MKQSASLAMFLQSKSLGTSITVGGFITPGFSQCPSGPAAASLENSLEMGSYRTLNATDIGGGML